MSSNYSCSPEDDFVRALNRSLTTEYHTQDMNDFMSNLMEAMQTLDSNPEEEFIATEQQRDRGENFDTSWQQNLSRSPVDMESKTNDVTETEFDDVESSVEIEIEETIIADSVSVDLFEDEPLNDNEATVIADMFDENTSVEIETTIANDGISVDMFDDELSDGSQISITPQESSNTIDFNDDHPQQSQIGRTSPLKQRESADVSVDLFTEFEGTMDVNSQCSDKINGQSNCSDFRNEEVNDQHRTITIEKPIVDAFPTDLVTAKVSDRIDKECSQIIDTNAMPVAEEKFGMHSNGLNASINNVENEQLDESLDVFVCIPSDCGSSVIEVVPQSRTGLPNFTESFPMREPFLPKCEGEHIGGDRASESLKRLSESTMFIGVSYQLPHAPSLHNGIDVSQKLGDVNSHVHDECLNLENFVPQRSPNQSTSFHGFDVSKTQGSSCHNSVRHQSENELVTTFCEEFETARCFLTDWNATQSERFNFDEAYSQCFAGNQNQSRSIADRRQLLINEIEKFIFKLTNDLVCGRELTIEVSYTVALSNCVVNDARLQLRPLSDGRARVITKQSRIAIIVYILSLVHKLLINRETCNKREIYYSDPEFTQNQAYVDRAIIDVCLLLNAQPWELGILSSSKGLMAGSIKLTLCDDTILDVESFAGGISLPQQTVNIKKVETVAKFVLLVEKHTVYEKLLLENVLNRLGPCILVTGKGYPDINTRAILKKIWDDCKCPIYALVDADPHGIDIMLTYRHGSTNMSFSNDNLAIPSVQWIGVFPSEINKLKLLSSQLTKEDINRMGHMIKRQYVSRDVLKELLILQKISKKSEVEALMSDEIVVYLLNKIETGDMI